MEYLKLIRPKDWVKNLFLLIPAFFSGKLEFSIFLYLMMGFVAFSMAASSIYILNDYRDIEADKLHPVKSLRPLASGKVNKPTALVIMVLLVILAEALSYYIRPKFCFVLNIYLIMNIFYSFGLKNISVLDILIVAAGFVLRVKSGGIIAGVAVSSWLNVMIFLLALFMAVAKRRDDILLKIKSGLDMRKAVKGYNLDFLNVLLALICSVTLVAYIMYTVSPEVIMRHNQYRLYYTCLFVIAGIMRYLQLAFVENDTGSPTSILYKDRFIQATIFLWILSFCFILYVPDIQIFK